MKITFFKFHGTGNDFIIIDSEKNKINEKDYFFLKKLCNRNMGIGSDGIILIKRDTSKKGNFEMKYYNSNGKESTMCGNGGRCAVYFYKMIKNSENKYFKFKTLDGYHKGIVNDLNNSLISIDILPLKKRKIEIFSDYVFLDNGSPHCVFFREKIENINVKEEGYKIRNKKCYSKIGGTNVNFVKKINKNTLMVRTYERGVEKETLSCGTGVTASVIASCITKKIFSFEKKFFVHTLGGDLIVSLEETEKEYNNIYLTGVVNFVFKGYIFRKNIL